VTTSDSDLQAPASVLRSVIGWTTMACNFKCQYCWEVQAQERGEFKPVPFRPTQDWLAVWNHLRPQLLDITGEAGVCSTGLQFRDEAFLRPWLPARFKAGRLQRIAPTAAVNVGSSRHRAALSPDLRHADAARVPLADFIDHPLVVSRRKAHSFALLRRS
jgi:hypothetical protein